MSLAKELASDQFRESPEIQSALATTYNSWGVLERSENPDRARDLYTEGLQIRERLLGLTKEIEPRVAYAKSLANLAQLDLSQGKADDAIDNMERSVDVWDSVVASAPENLSYQVGFADSLRNLALVYADRKDFKNAAKLSERAQRRHDTITAVPLRFTSNRLRTVRLRAYLKSKSNDALDPSSALSLLSDAAAEWELLLKRGIRMEPQYSLEAAECFADFGALLYNFDQAERACTTLDKAADCVLRSSQDGPSDQVAGRQRLFKILERSFLVRARLGQSKDSRSWSTRHTTH